jgi:hypothetical protein
MLLKEILAKFENPRKAAEVGRMGYRLSLRWYDRGIKRLIPPMHVLVAWAEHLDLSNADLGELIRDGELERMRLTSKIKMKRTRESEVEIQVEKHRRSLNRDIQQLEFEDELSKQAAASELSDLDKEKQEVLDSRRRMSILLEQQTQLLKEIKNGNN